MFIATLLWLTYTTPAGGVYRTVRFRYKHLNPTDSIKISSKATKESCGMEMWAEGPTYFSPTQGVG